MNIDEEWLKQYPDISRLLKPSEKYTAYNFKKFDEESCNHIANKLFKRYSTCDKIGNNEVKKLISDAYYFKNDTKNITETEIEDYLMLHSNGKESITIDNLREATKKYLGSFTKIGINILKDEQFSEMEKLEQMIKKCNNDKSEVEQMCINIFNKFNKDKNGYLDMSELKELIKEFYLENDLKDQVDNLDDYLKDFTLKYDSDKNSKISYEEFCEYIYDLKYNNDRDN